MDIYYSGLPVPMFVCEQNDLFIPGTITAIQVYENYFIVTLKEEARIEFLKILEENKNKFIAITIKDTHSLRGYTYTNNTYIGGDSFCFYSSKKLIDDDFLDEIRTCALMILDGRKKIKDFLDIPFYSTMQETTKILKQKNLNYEVSQKSITITDEIKYRDKTITKCNLLFSFDKLFCFEAKFEKEYNNEPSLDDYIDDFVSFYKMRKTSETIVSPKYNSCSGITLSDHTMFAGNSISLFDEEKFMTALDIEKNEEEPLGYKKWTVSRFRMLAKDNLQEYIMFKKFRIYDISDDGNYITLIDYYDNTLKAKISPENKTEELINRILYLYEQRQIYHATNCFADYYGYIDIDETNQIIFYIEMID